MDDFSSLASAFTLGSLGSDPAWGPSLNPAAFLQAPRGARLRVTPLHPARPPQTATEPAPGDEGAQLADVTRNAQGPARSRDGMSLGQLDRPSRHLLWNLRKHLRTLHLVECASQLRPPPFPPCSLFRLWGSCPQEAAYKRVWEQSTWNLPWLPPGSAPCQLCDVGHGMQPL